MAGSDKTHNPSAPADELSRDTEEVEARRASEVADTTIGDEEEPLTAADIFPCDDDDDGDDEICEPEPCPECIPDPNRPVPNWKNRIRPFLNERTCDYQVTIWTDYTLQDWSEISQTETSQDWIKTDEEMFDEWMDTVKESARLPGVAKLLEFYTKDLNYTGPPPKCHPAGTVLVPGEDGWRAIDEYGCDRLGGPVVKSDDADIVEEDIIEEAEAAGITGNLYRDPNGELLEERPHQGQQASHWTDGTYYWDSRLYAINRCQFDGDSRCIKEGSTNIYTDDPEKLETPVPYDGRDSFSPHGWIPKKYFFHQYTEEDDGTETAARIRPNSPGSPNLLQADGETPLFAAVMGNGIPNTILEDIKGTTPSKLRNTHAGAYSLTYQYNKSTTGNEDRIHSSAGNNKTSVNSGNEAWGIADGNWHAAINRYIDRDTEDEYPLRIDNSGHMYVWSDDDKKYYALTWAREPGITARSPTEVEQEENWDLWLKDIVYWMGDRQRVILHDVDYNHSNETHRAHYPNYNNWSSWNVLARQVVEFAKAREAGRGISYTSAGGWRQERADVELSVGTATPDATAFEVEGPEVETEWSSPPEREYAPWDTSPEYEEPDAQWLADVERSKTGQFLLGRPWDETAPPSEHVKVKKRWHQTGADGRIKVQVAIPSAVFNQIPEMQPSEPQPYSVIEDWEEQNPGQKIRLPYEVEFTTEDVADGMFTRIRWLLRHYANKRMPMADYDDSTCVLETFKDTGVQAVDSIEEEDDLTVPELGPKGVAWNAHIDGLNDGPSPYTKVFTPTQLETQADNVRDFKSNLLDFLGENLPGWQFSYLSEHNKRTGIEKIKIEFSPRYQIKSVTYNLRGCPPQTLTGKENFKRMYDKRVEEMELGTYSENPFKNPDFRVAKGWGDFAYTYPQSDPRTMAYIASAPYLDDAAQATTPMEWQDFMTLWTYPRVEIGNFNDLKDNNGECNSVSDALENILQSGFDIFMEVLLSKFDQQLCKTIADGAKDSEEYWARYRAPTDDQGNPIPDEDRGNKDTQSPFVRDLAAATRAATLDVLADDPMLKHWVENIEYIRDIDGLWGTILGSLTWCGLLDFIETLFACLFQGVDFGEILEQALISALKKMDIGLFKRLLLGLPPWVQNQIAETASAGLSDNTKNWRPWDSEPSAEHMIRTEDHLREAAEEYHLNNAQEQLNENPTEVVEGTMETTTTTDSSGATISTTTVSGEVKTYSNIDDEVNSAIKQQAKEAAGEQADRALEGYDKFMGIDDAKKTQTLGSILVDSGAMQEIKEAYIEALMELLTPDEIVDLLENLPGFAFLKKLLNLTKCPGVTIFHPPLKGWFNDLSKALSEWEPGLLFWCTKPLYIPELLLNRPFLIWDVLKALAQLLLEALEAAIVQALLIMLKMLIKWILELLCSMMGALGAAALTAVGLMSAGEFRQLMKDSLCGSSATDQELQSALGTVMSALGMSDATTEEELRNVGLEAEAVFGQAVEELPVLTVLELFSGEPSTASIMQASEFFDDSDASFADRMSRGRTCADVFKAMGQTFIGTEAIDKLREAYLEKMRCMNEAGEESVPFCSLDSGRQNIMDAFANMGLNLSLIHI